jgi:hypothetical protein
MADVDRLLDEFVASHRAGSEPEPRHFLDQVEGDDRVELAALIDAYLARAPRRGWDPEAFSTSPARDVTDALVRSLSGASGAWPVLLPQLRSRAKLRRDEVVRGLTEALGVAGREQDVAIYYHRMEQGSLPAAGVSERALEALGKVLGTSAAVLRSAGEAVGRPARGEAAGAVFTRLAGGDDVAADEPTTEEPPRAEPGAGASPEPRVDEVDRLFTGG